MPQHDLLVIGAGPGGYHAALRAAELGMDVACVDREKCLGGTCLRVGCIPSKLLLEATERWAEPLSGAQKGAFNLTALMAHKNATVEQLSAGIASLFARQKVTQYCGVAQFISPHEIRISGDEEITVQAKRVLIATGSVPIELPALPYDNDRIGDSTTALAYNEVPRHLVIVGGGNIGLELGSVWHRLGARVTVLEFQNRILPGVDEEIAREAMRLLKRQGIEILTKTAVQAVERDGTELTIHVNGRDPIQADRILVAAGRKPALEMLQLEKIGLTSDQRLRVDSRFCTQIPDVYAIGDVICGPMLAHRAEAEARAVVERMAGLPGVLPEFIPAVTYLSPEIASVGATEEALKLAQIPYVKGVAFFKTNGRAHALGCTDGRVKVLADAENHQLLGVHIIGCRAGDLISEATLALNLNARAEDLAHTCHPHPTLAETLRDAAQNALS